MEFQSVNVSYQTRLTRRAWKGICLCLCPLILTFAACGGSGSGNVAGNQNEKPAPAPAPDPAPPSSNFTFEAGWSGTGDFLNGQTVTITKQGGGLGTGPAATLYEDFEGGAIGQKVTEGNNIFHQFSPNARTSTFTYSDEVVRTGAKSGRAYFAPDDDYSPGIRGVFPSPTNEVYYSVWVRPVRGNGAPVAGYINNFKMMGVNGVPEPNATSWIHPTPGMVLGFVTNNVDGQEKMNFGGGGNWIRTTPYLEYAMNSYPPSTIYMPSWVRISVYNRLSSPAGAANGARWHWVNGYSQYHAYAAASTSGDPPWGTADTDQNACVTLAATGAALSSYGSFFLHDYFRTANTNKRTGTARGGTARTIQLDENAPSDSTVYLAYNDLVNIESGTGAGQTRYVGSYDGSTKIITLRTDSKDWITIPDATSVFRIEGYQWIDYKVYYDDLYIAYGANAFARLEISDSNQTWTDLGTAAPVQSELQNQVLSWTDTSIRLTVNKKGHGSLTGKYLWLITGNAIGAQLVGQFQ